MTWCFDDEASDSTDAVLRRAAVEGVTAPPHWSVEVTNALLLGERRNCTTPDDTAQMLAKMDRLRVTSDDELVRRSDLLELARTHRLTAYDAAYLELATRLNLPLATLDRRLREACDTTGVPLLP